MSNYLETKLINATLRGIPYVTPTKVFIALSTSDSNFEEGIIGEVTGDTYARQEIIFGESAFDGTYTNEGQITANTNEVRFPRATVPWGVIKSAAIMDAAEGGNVLFYNKVTTPRTIEAGDMVMFLVGDFKIALD